MTKRTSVQRWCVIGSVSVLAFMASTVASPREASAQEWLKDRASSEGPGLRAGDFEFHPSIGGEAGYDSNWFLRSDKTGAQISNGSPNAPRRDAGEFRLTPALYISTLGRQRTEELGATTTSPQPLAFRAGLSGTWRTFVGTEEIRQQDNQISANGDFRLDILPARPWSFAVFGSALRTVQPNTFGDPDFSYNNDTFGAGGEIRMQPHMGTFTAQAGYQFHSTIFEDTNGVPFNNTVHEVFLRSQWAFRPQTALLFDGTFRAQEYADTANSNTELHNSTPLRARVGLNGLITPRLSAIAMVGWGASFFTPGTTAPQIQQYDSVIANASVTYSLAAPQRDEPGAASLTLSSITVGYNRDFASSFLSDFYGTDRGYAKFSYFFASRVLINLEAGAGAIEYPRVYYTPLGGGDGINPIHSSFTDARVDGTIFGEYRLLSSLGINATLNYQQNISNVELPTNIKTAGGVNEVYDMSWKRFQAFIGLRYFL